MSAEIT
jgi:hypothetical protein